VTNFTEGSRVFRPLHGGKMAVSLQRATIRLQSETKPHGRSISMDLSSASLEAFVALSLGQRKQRLGREVLCSRPQHLSAVHPH